LEFRFLLTNRVPEDRNKKILIKKGEIKMKKSSYGSLLKGLGLLVLFGILCLFLANCGGGGGGASSDQNKIKATQQSVQELNALLENFKANAGRYPTTEEGLQALTSCPKGVNKDNWKGPYVEQISVDAWKNQYMYQSPGPADKPFIVFSKGPDGKENTQDDITASPAKAGGKKDVGEM